MSEANIESTTTTSTPRGDIRRLAEPKKFRVAFTGHLYVDASSAAWAIGRAARQLTAIPDLGVTSMWVRQAGKDDGIDAEFDDAIGGEATNA